MCNHRLDDHTKLPSVALVWKRKLRAVCNPRWIYFSVLGRIPQDSSGRRKSCALRNTGELSGNSTNKGSEATRLGQHNRSLDDSLGFSIRRSDLLVL